MPDDTALPTSDLPTALDFTPDDLQANRAGTLSDRQRATLAARRPGLDIRPALFYLGIAVVLAVANLFANRSLLLITEAMFAFSGLLSLLDYAYRRAEVRRAAQRGIVAEVTGRTYCSRALRRQAAPTLTIEDQTFAVSPAVWEAVPDGATYTVYYTPTARIVVAAEAA